MRIPFFKRHKASPSPPPAPDRPLSALEDFEIPTATGHRLALHGAADIMTVLQEQTQRAFGEASNPKTAISHESELHAQPALVDVRGYVLNEVLALEQLLKGARRQQLRPEFIECLEAAVDHGHELVVLLAECAIATAQE